MNYLVPGILSAGILAAAMGGSTMARSAPQPMDLVRAVERAEALTKGQVMEVDLDRGRGGKLVYEIDVTDGRRLREIRIDAFNGRLLHDSVERIEGLFWRAYGNRMKDIAGARPLSATLRELEVRTGGKVIDVDFDVEDGQARYEVELSTDTGIAGLYIDPQTGKRLDFIIDD